MTMKSERPAVTELRLSAFKSFRGARLRLAGVSVLVGPSGAGKSNALEALSLLGRLAGGMSLGEALTEVRGGPSACVPLGARPDGAGRRGFRIGCTVDGPLGRVRLDLAVQVEPRVRIAGERLSRNGQALLETALRDPRRKTVQAAWYTAGAVPVTRAPLPDDRLGSALLPLRVAGSTEGQRQVIAAAEQLVVGLRGVFPIGPVPALMRGWAEPGDTLLHGTARNLSAVLRRTERECRIRHGLLGETLDALVPYPVGGLTARRGLSGRVMAAVLHGAPRETGGAERPCGPTEATGPARPGGQGSFGEVPLAALGDGELRALAVALVLLTGPGVLSVEPADVPDALQLLTVLAEDIDGGLDRRQCAELLRLAERMRRRGHVRVVASAHERDWLDDVQGVTAVELPLRQTVPLDMEHDGRSRAAAPGE